MKRTIVLILLMSCTMVVSATIRTVSNAPSTLAQFSTIQDAIDASSDGDTVYVYGSPNTYASFIIADKKITVIGPGWSPDKNLPNTAVVAGCFIRNTAAPGTANGSEIHGLVFSSTVQLAHSTGASSSTSDLRIIRCQFNSSVSFDLASSNVLFEGNIFYNVLTFNSSPTYTNFMIQNNMFFFSTCCLSFQITGLSNAVNVQFDHNLFYSSNNNGGNTVSLFTGSNDFLTFSNNIFDQVNAGLAVSSSTFTNNITNNASLNPVNAASNDTPWLVNSNVDGGGNVSNQNPQMADQAGITAGNSSALLNFTIASGPANDSGSDGKDMGLLFDAVGSLNWSNSRSSRLPRIFSMNITTPTVPEGGDLSVTVDARKSN